MKNQFFKLILGLLMTLFIATAVAPFVEQDPLNLFYGLVMAGIAIALVKFIFMTRGYTQEVKGLALGVAVEFWDTIIAKNLYRDYAWLGRAKDRSANVLNSTVVHIPQAGAVPSVTRNRTQYPIPMVKRSDTDITYVIDELSSDTTAVFEAEKWELSYDKIPDVLDDHIKELGKRTAQNALYRWLASLTVATNIVKTTGAATATYLTGATGNRNKYLAADVASAKTLLIDQTKKEMNANRRALVISEGAYNQLKSDSTVTDKDTMDSVGAMWRDGDLVKIHGFDIIRTDVLPRMTNAWAAKDPLDTTVTSAATDEDVALLVDFDLVHIARSAAKMFYEANNVQYQADIMNALCRMGASRERNDQAGVIGIAQQ